MLGHAGPQSRRLLLPCSDRVGRLWQARRRFRQVIDVMTPTLTLTVAFTGKKDGEGGGRKQNGVGRKPPAAFFFYYILFPSRSNHVSWGMHHGLPSFSPSRLAFGFLV